MMGSGGSLGSYFEMTLKQVDNPQEFARVTADLQRLAHSSELK